MSINNEIQNFALERSVFSRAELLENFSDFDEKTLSQQLYRLVKSKNLERVGRGVYRLTASIFPVSDEMRQLNNMLKKQFPFAVFCLRNSEALMPFMHHIPDLDYIYIDVEREAAESVFNFLKGKHRKFVFFRPDKEEYQRYVAGSSAIIIRILVSEAPLQNVGNILIPTIEKMLVDIAGDVEFDFLQGAEISYFYRNVLDRHKINKRKLIRYATRRGRSEQVKQLYNNAL